MRPEYPKASAASATIPRAATVSYDCPLWKDTTVEAVKARLGSRQFLQVFIRVNAVNISFCEKRDESAWSEAMRRLALGSESLAPGLPC